MSDSLWTPWTAAHQAPLSFSISWSLFKVKQYLASLVAQMVKNLLAMQEIRVQSLGWEDPLEKETATHSSVLVRKIPWTEEPSRPQYMLSQRFGHN